MEKLKKRIFDIIQIGNKQDHASRLFDYFIVITIFANLSVTFMLTFSELAPYKVILENIELVTIIIFTVEYILRLWTSGYLYPDKSKGAALLAFVISFYGLIDLFSFLPYYLPFFFPAGIVAFRMLRVIRIFRLFKINSQYDAFNVIIEVVNDKKNQLISSMVLILIFLLSASLCMYSFENDVQPEAFKNAFSGMWWAVSALLTVGYGDIYPVTFWGQFFAIIIAFLGVGLVAVPTGIISAGFIEKYTSIKKYHALGHDISFKEINIKEDHPWIGQSVKELDLNKDTLILMIERDKKTIIPNGNTVIEKDDGLILFSRDDK